MLGDFVGICRDLGWFLAVLGDFRVLYANLGRFWSNFQIFSVILCDYKVIYDYFVATYRGLGWFWAILGDFRVN